jgi:tRNA(Arg) A34 adenosine deaminase TadA
LGAWLFWCRVEITLPDWLWDYYESLLDQEFHTDEEMMSVAIEISHQNVKHETGGPFGAAIFVREIGTGVAQLFSVGANRVVALSNSTLHGEMTAIQFAQQKLGHFSMALAQDAREMGIGQEYIMATSCEPCAMCVGGIFWSGLSELLCAATKDDAEAIGFDEGPVFPESYIHLQKRGTAIKMNILRSRGAAVLREYAKKGVIYNSFSKGDSTDALLVDDEIVPPSAVAATG